MLPSLRTVDDDIADALHLLDDFDFEAALPILGRAVAFAPENALAYELWVFCHLHLGRFERVLQLADEGLGRGLAPASLHLDKALAFLELQRLDEAAAAADAALALDPELVQAIRLRAQVEVDRGEHEVALQLLQKAMHEYPDDIEVHDALLTLADQLDRYPLVIEAAREYLRKFEKDPEVLEMLGHAYAATRDYRRADRAFRDAAHLEPDEVSHHVNVLMLALTTNNVAAHDAYLARLAEHDPEMADHAAHEVEVLLSREEEL